MLEAAFKAAADIVTPPLRAVLIRSVLLALAIIVVIGVALQRLLSHFAATGATWAEQTSGFAPHSAWAALAWILSIMAGVGDLAGGALLIGPGTNVGGRVFARGA